MDVRNTVKPIKITVCGGGNGAQALVAIAAGLGGCEVDIYAPFADEADRLRQGTNRNGGIESVGMAAARGMPHRISADPSAVIPGSEIVFLVAPAFAHKAMLDAITPYLGAKTWVGALPARGGFDYAAFSILTAHKRPDVRLFGLQTLPWSCRIEKYGESVRILGIKSIVDVATRPAIQVEEMQQTLQSILGLSMDKAANFLALTLANVGQLIHPGIMYSLFAGWDGKPYRAETIPLFYQSLNEKGAAILQQLSDDIQHVRSHLTHYLDLSAVRPLHEWLLRSYPNDIADPSTLRSAFVSNRAYAGLKAPMQEVAPGEYAPDFKARYLAEDAPYGLAISRAIAQLAGVRTPMIDEVLRWAGARLEIDLLDSQAPGLRTPQNYGIHHLKELLEFTSD